ncbi:MAG: enoyl-CoA hydratase/isomerase family protein [Alphaproteobacteria bacterium]
MTAVLVREEGPVRVVTLNRPERLNAIDMAMLDGLDAALAGAEAEAGVRAILLEGAGRAFSAGDDLEDQLRISADGRAAVVRQVEVLQRISERMLFGAKPVVGAVQGWAVGGGFAWTLNCDFALWAEDARGFLPEIAYGLFVSGGASWLLPRLAGAAFAREMILRGRPRGCARIARGRRREPRRSAVRLRKRRWRWPRNSRRCRPTAWRAPSARCSRRTARRSSAMRLEAEACIAGACDPVALARLTAVAAGRKSR